MKGFLVIIPVLFASVVLSPKKVETITEKVFDKETRMPIAKASIVLFNSVPLNGDVF